MARKRSKKRYSRKHGFTLPIAVVAGIAGGGGRLVYHATHDDHGQGNPISNMAVEAGRIYTGYDSRDGSFNAGLMRYGTLPLVVGIAIHKIVGGMLGVNRLLARTGLPVIRI
jgi:hypothetical protein